MLTATNPASTGRGRHRRRSDHAGGVQQSVHGYRRADGRNPGQYRSFGGNIKERLDFSCALFDADGQLIANAPHIRSISGWAMRFEAIIDAHHGHSAGDVYATNAPTTAAPTCRSPITPRLRRRRPAPVLRRLARPSRRHRRHHARLDAAGQRPHRPGGRACWTTVPLVSAGQFREQDLLARLGAGPWPARNASRTWPTW